jgi:1-acyl-sn-glycerol-3-phosphate acyltransferase
MSSNAAPADDRGPLARLGSACRAAVFFLWSSANLLAVIVAACTKPDSDLWYRLIRSWVRVGLGIFGVRIEADGIEKLRPGDDYIVLANHRSHFDIFAIIHAFGERETRWVAKSELEKVPIFGLALRVTGQILIDRKDHSQAIRELKKNLGKRGASVVFFPEGHRAETTELLPFKKGGAAFALDAGLPVVPIALSGSERLLPVGSRTPRPGTIRMRIGDPIDVTGMARKDREELTARVREAIDAMLVELDERPEPTPASSGAAQSSPSPREMARG